MTKKIKILIIIAVTILLFGYWAALALTHTKFELINYWWEAALSAVFIMYGIFGFMVAKHWSWLKSGVGSGIFFIAFGLIMWGIAQAGWTYFVIKDPAQQNPPSYVLDVLYFTSIPLWFYGMYKLSKATGAKYGLRSIGAKIAVVVLIILMCAVSYYFLVDVARGGTAYFHKNSFWNIFFDLGYAVGDVINLTFALAIFGLSWKYLGGRFKKPILLILLGFALIYLADFLYSYYDGKGLYYNGQWTDLLYLSVGAVFGLGLAMMDPTTHLQSASVAAVAQPSVDQEHLAPPQPLPSTNPSDSAEVKVNDQQQTTPVQSESTDQTVPSEASPQTMNPDEAQDSSEHQTPPSPNGEESI